MIKQALIIAAALSMAACSKSPGTNSVPVQYSPPTFTVSVVWEKDREAVKARAALYGHAGDVEGFSIMTKSAAAYTCEIHMVTPTDLTAATQELIGHEFTHCLYGQYHP